MTPRRNSNLRLEADTDTVDELVSQVRAGRVRVPSFQRPLRWHSDNVVQLFDSIYRGYPIGSFLLRKGPADAGQVTYGPLTVDAPETQSALWVVDGQQRLTALTAGLARPGSTPKTPDDPWVVFFDAANQTFEVPPKSGVVPDIWVPVAQLLDASALSEWVFNWTHGGSPEFRRAVFDAGTRLRQYQIPLYVVETDDEELLRQIFYRINDSGAPLRWDDIHDALFGRKTEHPSTLRDLANELHKLGMGRPEEEQLLSCLIAFKGLDVTRSVSDHYRKDPQVLQDAVRDALPAIRRVLSFLKIHTHVPHLRLLPRSLPLVVLTRFFALFEEPKSRTVDLLTRWTWRTLLNIASFDERTVLRHAVNAITGGDEEVSVQKLLALIPRERQFKYVVPKRFDARAADSRIALVGMANLDPIGIHDHSPISVGELIEDRDVAAFRRVVPTEDPIGQSPANRILLPGNGSARKELLQVIEREGTESSVLRSHAISPEAATALLGGNVAEFIEHRRTTIEGAVEGFAERLAAWGRNDRPSVTHLLQEVEDPADEEL